MISRNDRLNEKKKGIRRSYTRIILVFCCFFLLICMVSLNRYMSVQSGEKIKGILEEIQKKSFIIDNLIPKDLTIHYNGVEINNKENVVPGNFSGGTLSTTLSKNAEIRVNFTGVNISWIAQKSAYYGECEIFLDGEFLTTVDLYSEKEIVEEVYRSSTLSNGNHTFIIKSNAKKNAKSKAYALTVDHFIIVDHNGRNSIVENDSKNIRYINANYDYYSQFLTRKLGHLLMYFFITLVSLGLLRILSKHKKWLLIMMGFITVLALLDEYTQSEVNGRTPSIVDFFIDLSGIILGLFVFLIFWGIIISIRKVFQMRG